MEFTPDQAEALDMIAQWHRTGDDEFRLGGLAGTGKTTIVTQLPTLLRLRDEGSVAFMAPTGKAASVLTRKLPDAFGATTVHQFMYRPWEVHCGLCDARDGEEDGCHGHNSSRCGGRAGFIDDASTCVLRFRYMPPDDPPQLLVIDEASMVGASMYEHLKEVGSQLLFVGDHGQLAPIDSHGGVMAERHLDVKLETIHRQAAGSPILKLAMRAREGKPIKPGKFGLGVECMLGSRFIADGADIEPDTLMLCYTNEMRKRLNKMARHAFGMRGEAPVAGDRVVCLKNNYAKGVANGQVGTVKSCIGAGLYYRLVVEMDDNGLMYEGVCVKDQFHEVDGRRQMRGFDMWTFGYALTVHKAQGSEADDVIIIQEDKMRYMQTLERRRWMYTAITRAKKSLTIYTPIYGGT